MYRDPSCSLPSLFLLGNSAPVGSPDQHPAGKAGSSDLDRLLSAIAGGDRMALEALYRRTSAKLYGIALRVLNDPGAAEEVLQDVYVTVWKKASVFETGRASVISWLAVITRNRAVDLRRRATLRIVPVDAARDVPADAPLASEIAEQSQEIGRLHLCLDALDERARALIRDAFLIGATYRELALREAVPLGTMKSLVRRGLLRLRKCMET